VKICNEKCIELGIARKKNVCTRFQITPHSTSTILIIKRYLCMCECVCSIHIGILCRFFFLLGFFYYNNNNTTISIPTYFSDDYIILYICFNFNSKMKLTKQKKTSIDMKITTNNQGYRKKNRIEGRSIIDNINQSNRFLFHTCKMIKKLDLIPIYFISPI
jgi:hypothetical protein